MGEVGYEGRSAITDYFFQKSMMMPDVLQEQLGDSGGVQGGDCGYGMNPLRQAIHHHKDSVVPLGVWEFSDHVYSENGKNTQGGNSSVVYPALYRGSEQ